MKTDVMATQQTIEMLNQQFGSDKINFKQVASGLIKAVLRFSEQAQAEIHLQGAHLTKWLDTAGRENIFNSSTAVYQASVPIRGGNPIIFPQFGPGEMSQHGFARNSVWQVVDAEITDAATVLTLELKPEDVEYSYRQQWPHDFVLTAVISLGKTLKTQLYVHNPNPYDLSFTLGFHTYLAVDDINSVEIGNFSNLEYMDNLRERRIFTETRNPITVSEFIDRRYQNVPATLTINDKSSKRVILMQTKHCKDAFVWNPWLEAEKKLADLAPNSYQKFVCVEPGNMQTPVSLASGMDFIAEQEIKRL